MKKNVSLILLVLVVGIIVGIYLPSKNEKLSLNKSEVENIINEKLVGSEDKATVMEINPLGSISEVVLDFSGQKDSLYVTSDGNLYLQKIIDLTEAEKIEEEVEMANTVQNKSTKPSIELFVMSYCPYGTQMEKGYLPAIKVLGDKIDSEIKFVNYLMHGEKEAKENVLQYCIQKDSPDVFESYLECFLENGEVGVDGCLAENGLTRDGFDKCIVDSTKEFGIQEDLDNESTYLSGRYPLFRIHDDLNKEYGIQGSPSIVINGQKIDGVGRDAQSILNAICSAFEVQPEECNEVLSSSTPNPGFGYSEGTGSVAEADCGV